MHKRSNDLNVHTMINIRNELDDGDGSGNAAVKSEGEVACKQKNAAAAMFLKWTITKYIHT